MKDRNIVEQQAAHCELSQALSSLLGQTCCFMAAGPGTGSMVTLDFGRKIRRESPVNNLLFSEEQRHYQGEFCLYIYFCAWRIDANEGVVCGSTNDNSHGGAMLAGLQQLVGQKVEAFELSSPGLDLILNFSNGLTLRLFCDQLNEVDGADNYIFFIPGTSYSVSLRSTLCKAPSRLASPEH